MLIHLMPKYLRSFISVQHVRHITHGELMSREIKRLALGGAWICGAARRENRLFEHCHCGLTGKLSLSIKLHKDNDLFCGMSLSVP